MKSSIFLSLLAVVGIVLMVRAQTNLTTESNGVPIWRSSNAPVGPAKMLRMHRETNVYVTVIPENHAFRWDNPSADTNAPRTNHIRWRTNITRNVEWKKDLPDWENNTNSGSGTNAPN